MVLGTLLPDLNAVLDAADGPAASLAFWAVAERHGATYLQTRVYRRPGGALTPSAHLQAGGLVTRIAPDSYPGSAAFNYVCVECNPLVGAIRQGLTTYRFSEFAPRTRTFADYWSALGEARIAEAFCATSYGRNRQVASLHLGFDDPAVDPAVGGALQNAGLLLTEKLMQIGASSMAQEPEVSLTPRERDSMMFVAEGKTDWEIAKIFGVSETTARFHVDNARRKLGAVNRTHAVARFLADSDRQ
jgi:DNA-binding CsgD family transcriptional regulator